MHDKLHTVRDACLGKIGEDYLIVPMYSQRQCR